jgi:flagellin-like protein
MFTIENKRGISQVITTVLLILVVIAAIVIIWAFVGPVITGVGKDIQSSCVTVSLEVVSCDANGEGTIRRNPGKGDLVGFKLVNETAVIKDVFPVAGETFDELESIPFTEGSGSIQVAAIVGDDQRICPPTQNPVPCV